MGDLGAWSLELGALGFKYPRRPYLGLVISEQTLSLVEAVNVLGVHIRQKAPNLAYNSIF